MDLIGVKFFLALLTFASGLEWWKHAVIYQVYPRSFYDSNGDGIGDIPGIINKTYYFKELGVDAVWLAPMYQSPQKDFGYDVSDFKNIDPIYGTFVDWLNLVKILHDAGIKVIMDFIPNHTSREHPWFKEALKNNTKYLKYYTWKTDSKKCVQTSFPNNWISVYGGHAWKCEEKVGKYYLHQFSEDQPDLDLNQEEVLKELEGILQFWMFYGVDGFRVNSAFALFEDPSLADETYIEKCGDKLDYDCYIHTKTADIKKNFELLLRFRKFIDSVPPGINSLNDSRLFITESFSLDLEVLKQYQENGNDQIADFPINFSFIKKLKREATAEEWVETIKAWYDQGINPNWMLGNHDNSRIASKMGRELVDSLNMLTLMLNGTAFTYSGEEIGMSNSFVRWDQTKDIKGIIAGQEKFQEKSRDPERGPFQWEKTPEGFTNNSNPWLPIGSDFWNVNCKTQNNTKSNRTHLNIYKQMVQLRKTNLFKSGSCKIETVNEEGFNQSDILAVYRFLPDNPTFFGVFNFGTLTKTVNIQRERNYIPKTIYLFTATLNMDEKNAKMGSKYNSTDITIPPKGAFIFSTQDLKIAIKVDANKSITFM